MPCFLQQAVRVAVALMLVCDCHPTGLVACFMHSKPTQAPTPRMLNSTSSDETLALALCYVGISSLVLCSCSMSGSECGW